MKNDGIIEREALKNLATIEQNMYDITLNPDSFQQDLAKEVARVANIARQLGIQMRREWRDMTKEESHVQAGHSESLLKAILKHIPCASGECWVEKCACRNDTR